MTAGRNAAQRRKYAHRKALKRIEELKAERLELMKKTGDLARELEQAQSMAADVRDRSQKESALEEKLRAKQDEIASLTRRLDALEVSNSAAEIDNASEDAARDLEAELDEARANASTLESALAAVAAAAGLGADGALDPSAITEAVSSLRDGAMGASGGGEGADAAARVNLETALAESSGLRQRLASQEAENESLRERISALKAELDREEARADSAEEARDALASKRPPEEEEIDDLAAAQRNEARFRRAEERARELARELETAKAAHKEELQRTLDGTFPKPDGLDFGGVYKDEVRKKGIFGGRREITVDGFLYRRSGAMLVVDAKGESATLPGKWFDDEEPASDLD